MTLEDCCRMKGTECKFVKYMEGADKLPCHSGLSEKL